MEQSAPVADVFVDRNGRHHRTNRTKVGQLSKDSNWTYRTKIQGQIDQTFTRSNSHSFVRQRSSSFHVGSDFAPL